MADRALHVGFDDSQNASSELLNCGKPALEFREYGACSVDIQLRRAAEEAYIVQPPQEKIRIGDGWLISCPEANRAGLGTSRLGAYAKKTSLIKARQGTTARSNCMDVKHRNTDRNAGDVRLNSKLWAVPARIEKKDICRGPTHIQANDAGHSSGLCSLRGADHAPGRTCPYRAHRFHCGGSSGDDSTR